MVVGEGFEPSKLSWQIYSLLPLTARESHQKNCNYTLVFKFWSSISLLFCWMFLFLRLFFLDDFVVFGEQLLMGFGVFFVYQDAVYGANLLALGLIVVPDALGA